METMLVRLKPYDPRRKFVLRRYVYAGIHFLVTRGWERVPKEIADYLRGVRQKEFDPYSPPAFDVCTHDEATAIDARERAESATRRTAFEAVAVVRPRRPAAGVVTTADLPGRRAEDGAARERDEDAAPARREDIAPRARSGGRGARAR
jgi:hypothetical protein